jgi:formylglycine-generating enzyme required for sulfatase activity
MSIFKMLWVIVAVSVAVFRIPSAACAGDVFHMPAGQTSLEFVPVGDVGNVADSTGYGAVDYTYQFGTYHVTSAQYCVFLNAVAGSDPYGLYNTNMAVGHLAASGIARGGGPGSYTYSVASGYENFAVNYVSWGSAARFVNWLNNGQPSDAEGPGTTETGAYTLNGAVTAAALNAVVRNPGHRYYIPSEDEQYKALYYKGGSTNASYWLYPTRNNTAPSNVLSTTGTNNANYKVGSSNTDPVHLLTPVGAFASTVGPYGEYDPAGDLWQWNEALISVSGLSVAGDRGGGFNDSASFIVSTFRNARNMRTDANYDIGLRIAEIPGPASPALLSPTPGWTNGVFGLTLSAPLGQQWQIQGSTDLSNWKVLGALFSSNTPVLFMDSEATNFNSRFYRAVNQ